MPARAALLALALIVSVGTAHAQQPSAAALATAKELITVKGAQRDLRAIVPGVIEQAKSVFLRSNPTLSKELNEVAGKLRAEYAPRGGELLNEAAKLYAARFTEQELKDALAFYKIAARPQDADRGAGYSRSEPEELADMGEQAVRGDHPQDACRDEEEGT